MKYAFLIGAQLDEFCNVAKHSNKTRELARDLFLKANLTAKEVAERLGIDEKTIGRWRRDENWDQSLVTYTMTKAAQMEMMVQQLVNIQSTIMAREEGERFATSKEADIMIKITTAIKNLETELSASDVIDVCIKVTNWLKEHDAEMAIKVTLVFDKFIKTRA